MKLPTEILSNLRRDIGYCPKNPAELDWVEKNGVWITTHNDEQLEVRLVKSLGCYAVAKRRTAEYGVGAKIK